MVPAVARRKREVDEGSQTRKRPLLDTSAPPIYPPTSTPPTSQGKVLGAFCRMKFFQNKRAKLGGAPPPTTSSTPSTSRAPTPRPTSPHEAPVRPPADLGTFAFTEGSEATFTGVIANLRRHMVEEHAMEQGGATSVAQSPPLCFPDPPPNPKHYKVAIKAVRVDLERVEVPREKREEAGCWSGQVEEKRTGEGGKGMGEGARDEENNLLVVPVGEKGKVHEKSLVAERRQKVVMREKLLGAREEQVPRMVAIREVAGQVMRSEGLVVGTGDHQVRVVLLGLLVPSPLVFHYHGAFPGAGVSCSAGAAWLQRSKIVHF